MICSTEDVRLVPLPQPQDALAEVLRLGAQKLLAQAIEAEVADWIDRHQAYQDAHGHRQVVRHGHLPARTITTGVGPVEGKQPRVHDRRPAAEREKFTSAILPPYLRKAKGIEELIPWLYLKGVSTGDFSEALAALLGPDAKGLSATTVTRLKGLWEKEYHDWSQRSLAGKHDVYVWADGVYFNIRLEGGRPARAFVMSTPSTVHETPAKPEESEGSVDVDSVDAPETETPASDGQNGLFGNPTAAGPYRDGF
jgi:transposase-like protein